ncbi:unnamed protein product [Pseudo-nitzschia multistriata]|uniref:C2 domain-containing protein n=1 Tax=Pseudo-nitzschia multistriata TaxID=183589 RepID=A0A448ZMF4_9STRA|nr:unnamed protein product [Pseudo-nitzschia multistriata]
MLVEEQTKVNPSWFESPVRRVSTSGGTAPFFRLNLTEEGLKQLGCRGIEIDKNYWIGKDLSHAQDEKDFYLQVLRIRERSERDDGNKRDVTEGICLLENFMFDYLGVLEAKSVEQDGKHGICQLLVMRNLRNNYDSFRMLDLKIGEKTAQAGWKGKSRMSALKHLVMDGLSNSVSEGYRLAGFDGCSEAFESMHPLMDILATDEVKNISTSAVSSTKRSSVQTSVGLEIDQSQVKLAKRIMLNSLDGTEMLRHFLDLHMEEMMGLALEDHLSPTEVAEIVSHELMSKLISLAVTCHKVHIPQKWIGSSVAVAYDSCFFPSRSSSHEDDIRSRVLVNIFDWGRSELLTAKEYEDLTKEDADDRDKYWDLYRAGIDQLSYNATRFYFHQFSNSTGWKMVTIQVMDFDSMSFDDYIGTVEIPLPDLSDSSALKALGENKAYKLVPRKLTGIAAAVLGSELFCSISWVKFPSESRLVGVWRVSIDRAVNLPRMDLVANSSDAYCMVMATTDAKESFHRQHFHQQTCIKARTLNPQWGETIDIPVARRGNDSSLMSELTANGISSIDDHNIPNLFEWHNEYFHFSDQNMKRWTSSLKNGTVQ